jgi:hypothetical protein
VAFDVRLTNGGDATDRIGVRGAAGSRKFKVHYLVGGHDVTRAVTAGTYRTAELSAGQSVLLVVRIARTAAARADDRKVFEVRAISGQASTRRDTVAAVVRR